MIESRRSCLFIKNAVSLVYSQGLIEAVDYDDKIQQQYGQGKYVFDEIIDASGCAVIPGSAVVNILIPQTNVKIIANSVTTFFFVFYFWTRFCGCAYAPRLGWRTSPRIRYEGAYCNLVHI